MNGPPHSGGLACTASMPAENMSRQCMIGFCDANKGTIVFFDRNCTLRDLLYVTMHSDRSNRENADNVTRL